MADDFLLTLEKTLLDLNYAVSKCCPELITPDIHSFDADTIIETKCGITSISTAILFKTCMKNHGVLHDVTLEDYELLSCDLHQVQNIGFRIESAKSHRVEIVVIGSFIYKIESDFGVRRPSIEQIDFEHWFHWLVSLPASITAFVPILGTPNEICDGVMKEYYARAKMQNTQ